MVERAASIVALVEPGAPLWAQRMMLKLQGYFLPQVPKEPLALWATTKALLPPAAEWPLSVVIVTDQNALAVSLGGVWLKLATGGPI